MIPYKWVTTPSLAQFDHSLSPFLSLLPLISVLLSYL